MGSCRCTPDDGGFDAAPLGGILDDLADRPGSLVPVLQATQEAYGYLPEGALRAIAGALQVPLSTVFGVATFYTQFRLEPRGAHTVRVCHGTACHVKGARAVTEAIVSELGVALGATAEDLSVTVEHVACVGCCGLAPVVLVDDKTYGGLDAKSARKLASKVRRERPS